MLYFHVINLLANMAAQLGSYVVLYWNLFNLL